MKDRSLYFSKLSEWTQLPGELPPGKTLVEIFGNKRVLIEQHRGLLCYSNSNILVKSGDGSICIEGENLKISCMSSYQLVICGIIHNISVKEEP